MPNPFASKPAAPIDDSTSELDTAAGKGRATPTRKEREAANLRPLVSSDRKASSKESRAKMAESRDRARIGMANGEEKYLGPRDKGPQRRFVRDYVDARFSVGELMIPFLGVVIVLTFISEPIFVTIGTFALWGFLAILVVDCVILGFTLNRKLSAKFGAGKVERGFRWYASMRAVQLRPMRLPKPQVKRGNFPA
ncbi:DUF3043 domain-containing protein [Lacisediminihabitans changchengi]|uniref:DUF3043 domain-containing protein n=1 Tax=Lacisediminihabitans changchengi TaxID=2787634 RepID=UPI0027DD8649|nr:DUF3043 domain-containing protein [Lacisediminihabitans changchengi]